MAAIQSQITIVDVVLIGRSNQTLCFNQVVGCQSLLGFEQAFYHRLVFFEQLILAFRYRTGNDQRSTGIVNQDRVNLIDDSIVM